MKYKIVGFAKQSHKKEWEKFVDTAIMECPDGISPYIYFNNQFKNSLDYWIVEYQEMKER